MTGRAEVVRRRQQLDATFKRASGLTEAELLSDFARHLCVLVSGFLEQATIELVLAYTRRSASPAVMQYVEGQIRRVTNLNAQRLIEVLGSFDGDWRLQLEAHIIDERKAAVDSIVDLRNTIAHGRYAGVTMIRVRDYYANILKVVDRIADLCDPLRL
jgi:hypothetical protein